MKLIGSKRSTSQENLEGRKVGEGKKEDKDKKLLILRLLTKLL